jgi:hypothetical protein
MQSSAQQLGNTTNKKLQPLDVWAIDSCVGRACSSPWASPPLAMQFLLWQQQTAARTPAHAHAIVRPTLGTYPNQEFAKIMTSGWPIYMMHVLNFGHLNAKPRSDEFEHFQKYKHVHCRQYWRRHDQ